MVEQFTIHSNSLQYSLRYLRSSLARLLRRTLESEQGARPAVMRPQQCLGKDAGASKQVTSKCLSNKQAAVEAQEVSGAW